MKFLDLFSGIGGFRRGLERSGHECIGHVEIDRYANISYLAMYELVPCKYQTDTGGNCCRVCKREVNQNCEKSTYESTYENGTCGGEWFAKDIKRIRAEEIPRAEIWTFGFPCTDISIAGRMAGLRGERSGLFFTVLGLLKSTPAEDKPAVLIIENVKHLVQSEGGGAFTTILTELWEAGYDAEWEIINSKAHGVPQNRERVFLVGYLGGKRGRKVFPVGGANGKTLKEIIGGTQGERVYDADGLSVTLTAEGGGAGGKTGLYLCNTKDAVGWSDCLKEYMEKENQKDGSCEKKNFAGFFSYKKEPDMTENARCLLAKYNNGITRFGENSGVLHCRICNEKCGEVQSLLTPDREEKRQNGRRIKEAGEPGFTLTASERHGIMETQCPYALQLPIREATKQGYVLARHGDGINLSYPNSKASRGRVGKQCTQTLLTEGGMGVMVYCRIRRLTPKECFRLQAFEDYLFERARTTGVSDAQLYKQAGNSVTVNVVYEIGKKIGVEGGVEDEI